MKNIIPAIVVVLIIGMLAWYFTSAKPPVADKTAKLNVADIADGAASNDADLATENIDVRIPRQDILTDDYDDIEDLEDIRPATELYSSAEQALEVLKNASKSYDDSVLEQFAEPDFSCTWCEGLYASLNQLITQQDISADEKSYYAEVMAISGRVDNVKALVDAIKSAPNQEDADIYAEALELAIGKDDLTSYLGSQLSGANDTLRESLIAALTNQNSRLAAELLYKNTVERGDADGYYASGIGLGEFIPDEDAMPFLQDALLKRDQFSHLAAKALLNSGTDGLRMVLDSLESSKDPDFDRRMLKDAIDHVGYDEDVENLLRERLKTTSQPAAREFIEESLKSFEGDDFDIYDTDDDEL